MLARPGTCAILLTEAAFLTGAFGAQVNSVLEWEEQNVLKGLFRRLRGPQTFELPGYTPIGVIREGSMAVIYKAKDRETGRLVAIKIHKPNARKAMDKLESAYRDFNEGQITAALGHENVVKCFDHGELGSVQYLILEYLEGMTLGSLTAGDSKRLNGHRVNLVCQMAAGLAHVHTRRFIHHDFCPKNIFVTTDNKVKLIDFGLATPIMNKPVVASRMGTTEILAPEKIRREPSDHQVDIFAWGVVAYEVLSGHWPFESLEQHQTLNKVLNVQPMPLNKRAPGVPEEVCQLVMRCLEKDPSKRLTSMNIAVGVCERNCNVRI